MRERTAKENEMTNQTQATNKLQDAITDLTVVDTLIARKRTKEAREMLVTLSEYVMDIYGGNAQVRDLMTKWQNEFGKRYAEAYS